MHLTIKDTQLFKAWDRLVLLLLSSSHEGWEHEFREIPRREIHWPASPEENEAGHDE
jgi:hypothetical protein